MFPFVKPCGLTEGRHGTLAVTQVPAHDAETCRTAGLAVRWIMIGIMLATFQAFLVTFLTLVGGRSGSLRCYDRHSRVPTRWTVWARTQCTSIPGK